MSWSPLKKQQQQQQNSTGGEWFIEPSSQIPHTYREKVTTTGVYNNSSKGPVRLKLKLKEPGLSFSLPTQGGAGIACWQQQQTCNRKVASLIPGRTSGIIFFSSVNFVGWLLCGVHSTPMLPQWHIKEPSHSAKSAGGRLYLNMHTPLTERSQSGLSTHGMGTHPETSSHAACL